MDIINTDCLNNSDFESAGKVNFNTSAKNDFVTNEAFKTLRSNILFCSKDVKVILITSTYENEGKSTIATELSKSLSDINKKTLLIDADMRKSVILPKNLKTQNILGLSELLSGQATLSDVLYETQIPNFNVIFSGRFPPNPVELLSTDYFKQLLNQFREVYDFIIIDSPPLAPVIDASVISVQCDGVVFVISADRVRINEATAVKNQIEKSGCKILGAVLNEVDAKHKAKSSYYKKNYYYAESSKSKSKFKGLKK